MNMPLRKYQTHDLGETDHIVEEWLKERQELLVLYYHLAKTTPFEEDDFANDKELLTNFCQILTDYVSAGHFEVFEKIAAASELHDADAKSLDRALLVKILRTTNTVMAFCNKHANGTNLDSINHDLSVLGEQLAARMDLEDDLIKIYLHATDKLAKHKQPVKSRL